MPLVLDDPEQLQITTVRITSFLCQVEPLSVSVFYVRGYYRATGEWVVVDNNSATFNQDEIAVVDPEGATYDAMKTDLYELLETRLGPGVID